MAETIAYTVAHAFARAGFPVRGVERAGDSLFKLAVRVDGKWVPVLVEVGEHIRVVREGRVLNSSKLDILLSRVGLRYDDLQVLLRYGLVPLYPGKTPVSYTSRALPDRVTVLFTLPLLYPFVLVSVEYSTTRRLAFWKRSERGTGIVTVNPLTLTYCTWDGYMPSCENAVRTLPPSPGLLKILAKVEGARVTVEMLSGAAKVPVSEAKSILEEAVRYGFAIPVTPRVYKVTRITPVVTTRAPNLQSPGKPAIEWHVYPMSCVRPAKSIEDSVKLVRATLPGKGRVTGVKVVLLPYIVVGGVSWGKRVVHAYNVLAGRPDPAAGELLGKHYDCLSLLALT